MTAALRPELSSKAWRQTRPRIKARDQHLCTVCGLDGWIPAHYSRSGRWIPGRRRLIVGHIIPAEQYLGSHNDPKNLRTMCVSCNNSQRDLTDEQWQEARAARGAAVAARPRAYGARPIFSRPTRRVFP